MRAARASSRGWALAAAVSAALAAAPARAAEPATPAPADALRSARVQASHRVDVIAPGEKVETIIDRMRAAGAAIPGKADGAPVGGARGGDRRDLRPPMERAPGTEGSMPMPGPGSMSGAPPPGAPPPLRTDSPPPDRSGPRRR